MTQVPIINPAEIEKFISEQPESATNRQVLLVGEHFIVVHREADYTDYSLCKVESVIRITK